MAFKIATVGDLKNLSPTSIWAYPDSFCPTYSEINAHVEFNINTNSIYMNNQLVALSDISLAETYKNLNLLRDDTPPSFYLNENCKVIAYPSNISTKITIQGGGKYWEQDLTMGKYSFLIPSCIQSTDTSIKIYLFNSLENSWDLKGTYNVYSYLGEYYANVGTWQ